MTTADDTRPPGWRESITAALREAPDPSPELCERVAGLVAPRLPQQNTRQESILTGALRRPVG